MKLLLDTHTFLWFINGDSKLSNHAKKLIENVSNKRLLSIASLWEISIKASIGRLKLNSSLKQLFADHIQGNAIELLHITPEHLDVLSELFFHHKDPFDRLIISQGKSENVPILSKDAVFDKYEIKRVWDHKIE